MQLHSSDARSKLSSGSAVSSVAIAITSPLLLATSQSPLCDVVWLSLTVAYRRPTDRADSVRDQRTPSPQQRPLAVAAAAADDDDDDATVLSTLVVRDDTKRSAQTIDSINAQMTEQIRRQCSEQLAAAKCSGAKTGALEKQ